MDKTEEMEAAKKLGISPEDYRWLLENRGRRPTVPERLVEDFSGRIAEDGLVTIPEALYKQILATLSPASHDEAKAISGFAIMHLGVQATKDQWEAFEQAVTALRSTPAPDALRDDDPVMQEIADGAYGDDPATRGRARSLASQAIEQSVHDGDYGDVGPLTRAALRTEGSRHE